MWMEASLPVCLKALSDQTYPRARFEIIVIDNGSTDQTSKIAEEMGAVVLHETKRSPYCARNVGINSCRGEWLAFTDAGCVPSKDWLTKLYERSRETNGALISGLTKYKLIKNNLGNRL